MRHSPLSQTRGPTHSSIFDDDAPTGFEGFFRELSEVEANGAAMTEAYARVSYGIRWLGEGDSGQDSKPPNQAVRPERTQCPEAFQHHARLRTKHVPMHFEEPTAGSMQERVDRLCLSSIERSRAKAKGLTR